MKACVLPAHVHTTPPHQDNNQPCPAPHLRLCKRALRRGAVGSDEERGEARQVARQHARPLLHALCNTSMRAQEKRATFSGQVISFQAARNLLAVMRQLLT